jgi:hypothetical protein
VQKNAWDNAQKVAHNNQKEPEETIQNLSLIHLPGTGDDQAKQRCHASKV